jgi:PAS domain S-box-containing protein/putative nucleotidyltransferase with HDIG domain
VSLRINSSGQPIGFQGIARDITERKEIEYELRASESNFRNSLDDSPLGVRISTIVGETIYANRAILDIYGYDSIEELKKTHRKECYTPESYAESQLRKEKRLRGEFGPSEYEISIVRKNGEIRHLHVFRKEIFWNGKKQSQVICQDITLRRQAEEKLKEILKSLRKSIKTTIQVLGTASEARDPYTAGHQKGVADLARAIATEMGLPNDTIEGIRMAGSIHDIGKLSVPTEILSKPTKLTNIEFSLIKEHSQSGCEMLKDVESPWPLAQIVYQHHERMDGSGYPRNLKGDEIIMEARIMAVADVVEAMASHRPYRAALGIDAALEEIEKNKGIIYDNAVADACLRLFREKNYKIP